MILYMECGEIEFFMKFILFYNIIFILKNVNKNIISK